MGRSKYELGYYWCSRCGCYVHTSQIIVGRLGELRHVYCGFKVRTKPLWASRKKTVTPVTPIAGEKHA